MKRQMADLGLNSSNVTADSSDIFLFGITTKLQLAILWLQLPIGIIILISNSNTFFVLYKTYMRQEVLRVLFASMSLSDATVGMLFALNCFVRQYPEMLTVVLCGFRFSALYCVVFVSMGSVALLALNRCIVLSFPYEYVRIVTARRAMIISVLLWMLSTLLAYISFMRPLQNCSVCLLLTFAHYTEVFLIPISFFSIVLVILIVCYTMIVYHVRIQMRKISKETIPIPRPIGLATVSANVDSDGVNQKNTSHDADATARKPKLRLRYLKTVTSILGLFLLCYTPLVSLFGYLLINPQALQSPNTSMVLNSSVFLMVINSIVNPILYTWKTRELQLKFLKLFCSGRCQARIHSIQQSCVI